MRVVRRCGVCWGVCAGLGCVGVCVMCWAVLGCVGCVWLCVTCWDVLGGVGGVGLGLTDWGGWRVLGCVGNGVHEGARWGVEVSARGGWSYSDGCCCVSRGSHGVLCMLEQMQLYPALAAS